MFASITEFLRNWGIAPSPVPRRNASSEIERRTVEAAVKILGPEFYKNNSIGIEPILPVPPYLVEAAKCIDCKDTSCLLFTPEIMTLTVDNASALDVDNSRLIEDSCVFGFERKLTFPTTLNNVVTLFAKCFGRDTQIGGFHEESTKVLMDEIGDKPVKAHWSLHKIDLVDFSYPTSNQTREVEFELAPLIDRILLCLALKLSYGIPLEKHRLVSAQEELYRWEKSSSTPSSPLLYLRFYPLSQSHVFAVKVKDPKSGASSAGGTEDRPNFHPPEFETIL